METVDASRRPTLSSAATTHLVTLLYYLAVLVGLLMLYGRGDVSTTGFIYQAF